MFHVGVLVGVLNNLTQIYVSIAMTGEHVSSISLIALSEPGNNIYFLAGKVSAEAANLGMFCLVVVIKISLQLSKSWCSR